MKRLQHLAEAALFIVVFMIFRLIPLDIASAIGDTLGRSFGPFMRRGQHYAKKSLDIAFPEKTARERQKILGDMWGHLGRVITEYPSLYGTRLTSRVNVIGAHNLPQKGQPAIFFSGHLGNWELLYPTAYHAGMDISIVYREANNPYIERMVRMLRKQHASEMIPKGDRSGIRILAALKRGGTVALLVDQKIRTGIMVPFFGREALTPPIVAELALKYGLPIIPSRVVRRNGAYFDVHIEPPLHFSRSDDHEADVMRVLTKINQTLEGWIREHPGQWFWVHRRWRKNWEDDY